MNVINLYLSMQRLGLNYDLNEKVYREMEKITLQDVVRFEQQQIARKPYRYVILGDEKELDMPSLEKIGPIRRLTIEEVFGY
jgi:predicted Zn-dependent peptidase